jgi:hypothetical protein
MSGRNEDDQLSSGHQEEFREDSLPDEDQSWEDFEYLETFLPRNFDF